MNPYRNSQQGPILAVLIVLATCCVQLGMAPSAAALEREAGTPSADPTGLVSLSPSRLERDVQPGVTQVIPYTVRNESDKLVDITLNPGDFGPSADPRTIGVAVEGGEFGAGDWLRPEVVDLRLAPFETVIINLTISPPQDAPVGTNLASLSLRAAQATGGIGMSDQEESAVALDVVSQVFLTVAGPVRHQLEVKDVRTRDVYLTGSTRFVVWDVEFGNTGTVNEHVAGSLTARSIFGNNAFRGKIEDLVILRGDSRTVRVVWRDPPLVGAFTPSLSVRADDAKLKTATGDRVVILPWWIPVLLVLALALPALLVWWRRRRDWLNYLDEAELDGVVDDDLALGREW